MSEQRCDQPWIAYCGDGTEFFTTQRGAVDYLRDALDDRRLDAMMAGEWGGDMEDWYVAEIKLVLCEEESDDAEDDGVDYILVDA